MRALRIGALSLDGLSASTVDDACVRTGGRVTLAEIRRRPAAVGAWYGDLWLGTGTSAEPSPQAQLVRRIALLLPGTDGSGRLFGPFMKPFRGGSTRRPVTYPLRALGFEGLEETVAQVVIQTAAPLPSLSPGPSHCGSSRAMTRQCKYSCSSPHPLQTSSANDDDQSVQIMVHGENVASLTDGLHGESFGEDGWQATYSKYAERSRKREGDGAQRGGSDVDLNEDRLPASPP